MLQIASNYETRNEVDRGVWVGNAGDIVAARLRRSGYPFLWGVTCTFSAGEVVLSGTVPTFYLKQVAQELARHTAGVFRVDNRLQVAGPPRSAKRTASCAPKAAASGQFGDVAPAAQRASQPVRHAMTSPPARETVASSAVAGSQEGTF